jgi:hypothetical protein
MVKAAQRARAKLAWTESRHAITLRFVRAIQFRKLIALPSFAFAVAFACDGDPTDAVRPGTPPEQPPVAPPPRAPLTEAMTEAMTSDSINQLFKDCASENLPEQIGRFAKCGTADKRHLHVVEIINRNQKPNSSQTADAWRTEGASVTEGDLSLDGGTWKTVVGRDFAGGPTEQMTATLAIEPKGVRSVICGDPRGQRCSEIVRRAIVDGLTPAPAPRPATPRRLPDALAGCTSRQLSVLETPTFIAECPEGKVASVTQVETSSAFKGVAGRLWTTQVEELRSQNKPFAELAMNGGSGKALRKQNYRGGWIVEAHVEDTPYRMRTISCEERPPTSPAQSDSATKGCLAVLEALVGEPPPYVGTPVVGR